MPASQSNGHGKWSPEKRFQSRTLSLRGFASELAAQAAQMRRDAMALESQAIGAYKAAEVLEQTP